MRSHRPLAATLLALTTTLSAQQPPQTNTSVLDANGTAHITRVIPVPTTISPEAQASLRRPAGAEDQTLAERRTAIDAWQTSAGETSRKAYPVKIESLTIANVPVRNVLPLEDVHPDHVLINVHGGGFNSDSGSFTESIPIANLTHTRVVSVLYRLAPEHPFPAAVDDTIAVYRDLLKTYKPAHIALYGTSAGAILTAEVAVRLKQLNLPLPAALGIFSGMGDFSQNGDSWSMYALRGLTGSLPVAGTQPRSTEYTGTTNPKDPVLSPLYADLHGMPPTLFITSGRDILLSGTGILHRAFLRSGDDARLIVFEALPHAFWNDISLPETKEAYGYMADFFSQQLNR
ncbi:alpha/beta hydrolase fold domain-containing protein [Tunturibacter empetritectus]|uniref:Acetyl esterase/lipase n=1 Tax=Tunturiibacter empetritectus TaxID=3069691 RepID=A0A7W8IEW1_9BACT|nr:alpha/beta hydrolase fold domain-containing protein [Edaphobacter lichenicola]MBB5315667.1 acetyl esterase/lipase [Edaphobacter lichenicola]